jgi:heme-degrading monooxygenase HmoA
MHMSQVLTRIFHPPNFTAIFTIIVSLTTMMKQGAGSSLLLAVFWTVAFLQDVQSFTTIATTAVPRLARSFLPMVSTADTDTNPSDTIAANGLLKRDRYVATNRFAVRRGKAAKFEKRWTVRKSRLATLDGFRYFHLMRRVTLNDDGTSTYDEGTDDESSQGNYVSFTIWKKKSDFSVWRSGEAFKEAHGGTSIGAFVSTLVSSTFVLRGAPKPAFYDGLLLQSVRPEKDNIAQLVDGWRSVEADGENTLPTECFIACNQFFVPPENAAAFEQRWASRESKLKDCDGFVSFTMLRRDASAKGHGVTPLTSGEPTYTSTTIWRDRQAFDNWRTGGAFQQAHGQPQDQKSSDEAKPNAPSKPLWSQPPKPVFYEGTLVITCEDGA